MNMFLVVLQCFDGAVTFGAGFARKRFSLALRRLVSVLVRDLKEEIVFPLEIKGE
jgi:hypothetical protein